MSKEAKIHELINAYATAREDHAVTMHKVKIVEDTYIEVLGVPRMIPFERTEHFKLSNAAVNITAERLNDAILELCIQTITF